MASVRSAHAAEQSKYGVPECTPIAIVEGCTGANIRAMNTKAELRPITSPSENLRIPLTFKRSTRIS